MAFFLILPELELGGLQQVPRTIGFELRYSPRDKVLQAVFFARTVKTKQRNSMLVFLPLFFVFTARDSIK